MEEIGKKLLYNLIGTLHITNNKFKELVEDLIQNGHYTEDEGRRLLDQWNADFQTQILGLQSQLRQSVDDFLAKTPLPSADEMKSMLEKVRSQVENLPFPGTKKD